MYFVLFQLRQMIAEKKKELNNKQKKLEVKYLTSCIQLLFMILTTSLAIFFQVKIFSRPLAKERGSNQPSQVKKSLPLS